MATLALARSSEMPLRGNIIKIVYPSCLKRGYYFKNCRVWTLESGVQCNYKLYNKSGSQGAGKQTKTGNVVVLEVELVEVVEVVEIISRRSRSRSCRNSRSSRRRSISRSSYKSGNSNKMGLFHWGLKKLTIFGMPVPDAISPLCHFAFGHAPRSNGSLLSAVSRQHKIPFSLFLRQSCIAQAMWSTRTSRTQNLWTFSALAYAMMRLSIASFGTPPV